MEEHWLDCERAREEQKVRNAGKEHGRKQEIDCIHYWVLQ